MIAGFISGVGKRMAPRFRISLMALTDFSQSPPVKAEMRPMHRTGMWQGFGLILAVWTMLAISACGSGESFFFEDHDGEPPYSRERYKLRPLDTITVKFNNAPKLNEYRVPIRPDGMITIQTVGDLRAVGLTPDELGRKIESHAVQTGVLLSRDKRRLNPVYVKLDSTSLPSLWNYFFPKDERSYRLQSGDVISVKFAASRALSESGILIGPDGMICIHAIGEIQAAEITPADLGTRIETKLIEAGILDKNEARKCRMITVHVERMSPPFRSSSVWDNRDRYKLRIGDLVSTKFLFENRMNQSIMLVRPDGMVTVHPIGDVPAAGLTLGQIARKINDRFGRPVSPAKSISSVMKDFQIVRVALGHSSFSALPLPPWLESSDNDHKLTSFQSIRFRFIWDPRYTLKKLTVCRDGTVALPPIGKIKASGLSLKELSTNIEGAFELCNALMALFHGVAQNESQSYPDILVQNPHSEVNSKRDIKKNSISFPRITVAINRLPLAPVRSESHLEQEDYKLRIGDRIAIRFLLDAASNAEIAIHSGMIALCRGETALGDISATGLTPQEVALRIQSVFQYINHCYISCILNDYPLPCSQRSAQATVNLRNCIKPSLLFRLRPQSDSYKLKAGDVITIRVAPQLGLKDSTLLVRPDGAITLDAIGDTTAAGLAPADLGQKIEEKLVEAGFSTNASAEEARTKWHLVTVHVDKWK